MDDHPTVGRLRRQSSSIEWTRTASEKTVLAEDCYGIYEEQSDIKYASEKKHCQRLVCWSSFARVRVEDFSSGLSDSALCSTRHHGCATLYS